MMQGALRAQQRLNAPKDPLEAWTHTPQRSQQWNYQAASCQRIRLLFPTLCAITNHYVHYTQQIAH